MDSSEPMSRRQTNTVQQMTRPLAGRQSAVHARVFESRQSSSRRAFYARCRRVAQPSILNLPAPISHVSRQVVFSTFVPSSETANPHLGREGRTQSPALEKASRTGRPKFTILIQSGRTEVVQDPAVKTSLRNA